jgi:Divergent InlB B-repeat domain
MIPDHSGSVVKVGHASATGSTPLLTSARIIDTGAYSTRPWLTEKHVFSSTGVPSSGTLVEIRNAVLSNVLNGPASLDCNDLSDTPPLPSGRWCDSVADANDGSGSVHLEIDQVYKYLGIAPADWPRNGTVVDIIGYSFYDGEGGGSPTSPVPGGWEIHPVTAWMFSGSSSSTFVLTVSAGSGGSTGPGPGSYTVAPGSIVMVTAFPSLGYNFSGFSVDGRVSTLNPVNLTMNSDHVLSASFVPSSSPAPPPQNPNPPIGSPPNPLQPNTPGGSSPSSGSPGGQGICGRCPQASRTSSLWYAGVSGLSAIITVVSGSYLVRRWDRRDKTPISRFS